MRSLTPLWFTRGIPIFPTKPDKSPYTPRGFKDATTDPATLRAWFEKWPDAGIGMPTGAASGLLVLDVDPRHGGDASLCELAELYGELPVTLESETGGGGFQIFFIYPEASGIRNSAGRLGPGLDVRGEGGYVILPPSLHASGRRYRWRNDFDPAPVPEWLLKLLTEEKATAARQAPKTRSEGKSGPAIGAVIGEGERNAALFRIGCSLRGKGADAAEIEAELSDINGRRCSPPLAPAEVQKIARSCATYAANRVAAGA